MYEIVEEKRIRNITNSVGQRTALRLVHIVCDTASDMPSPLPHWISGSRCDVLENGGSVYLLSSQRTWTNVNFYNQGGEGGGFDPDDYYTKPQTDAKITEKVAEIVADAPEDFDTLKEISDWITSHEDSAAAMNSAIQQNTTAIAKKPGKIVTGKQYTIDGKTVVAGAEAEVFNSITYNIATGDYSHAEGGGTTASGDNSHAEGSGTKASSDNQHVQGRYNVEDSNNKYAFVIGNGTEDDARHNAFAIDWSGLIYVNGASTGVDVNSMWQAVEGKVDKASGKGLSTEDYTTEEKTKLAGIASGAGINVQSDWNQTDSSADDFIKNKPAVPTVDQTFDATSPNAQSGVAIASVLGGSGKFDYLFYGSFESVGETEYTPTNPYRDYDIIIINISTTVSTTHLTNILLPRNGHTTTILEAENFRCVVQCGSLNSVKITTMPQGWDVYVAIVGIKI